MTTTTWPFLPSAVDEALSFKTDVRRAYSAESRDSLRDAVQSFTLSHLMLDTEASVARELFRSNPLGNWYVPVWPDLSVVGAVTAGAVVLSVNTDADYRVGEKAIVWQSYDVWELVDVSAIGTGSIDVSAVVGTYTAAIVCPVRECIAPGGLNQSSSPTFLQFGVQFVSLTAVDLAATSYPTIGGFQIVTDQPAAMSPLDGGIAQALQMIDSGFGAMELIETEAYVRPRFTLAFLDYMTETRWARRKWVHDVRGRDGAFWLPTWKADLPLTAAIPAASVSMTVEHVAPAATDYVGRYVQIDVAGSFIHREITGASVAAGVATLSIAAPGVDVPKSSRISFLDLYRFDTDQFSIKHQRAVGGFISSFSAIVKGVQA